MEIYSKDHIDKVLKTGKYKGHKWIIRTLGRYPTAYVTCDNMSYDQTENLDKPYFGITYSSKSFGHLKCLDYNYDWIGWDYGHYPDYQPNFNPNGEKHTIEEIEENIKEVIDELQEIK